MHSQRQTHTFLFFAFYLRIYFENKYGFYLKKKKKMVYIKTNQTLVREKIKLLSQKKACTHILTILILLNSHTTCATCFTLFYTMGIQSSLYIQNSSFCVAQLTNIQFICARQLSQMALSALAMRTASALILKLRGIKDKRARLLPEFHFNCKCIRRGDLI